jgi:hypothetical protein
MTYTPTGCFALQVEYTRDMLAACTAFQAWAGEPDASRVKERIYFDRLPDPTNGKTYQKGELQSKRPFAYVYLPDKQSFRRDLTSTHTFDESGTVEIYLEQEVPASDDQFGPSEEARLEWYNAIGLIIGGNTGEATTGLCDMRVAEAAGHLMFNRIRVVDRATSPMDWQETWGYFFWAILALEF